MTETIGQVVSEAVVECQIEWRPSGRLSGQFVAVYAGEAPWSLAGRSRPVRSFGAKEHVAESERMRRCLDELCATLESSGWQRQGSRIPGPWYALRLRRSVPGVEDLVAETPLVQEPAVSPADPVDASFGPLVRPLGQVAAAAVQELPAVVEHEFPAVVEHELPEAAGQEPPVEDEPSVSPTPVVSVVPADEGPWWDLHSTARPASPPIELDSEFCERVRRYVA